MADTLTVVLVVPIVPSDTGNGLAMRAGMLLEMLASAARVHVVVVPVSGPADDCTWAAARARTVTVIDPVRDERAREHITRQLADPELRARLERTAPLPSRAALAPPTLAAAVVDALPKMVGPPDAVLAMRLYLAPLGVQLARRLSAGRVVVDADDDDVAILHSLGEHAEADAFERVARCWLPDVDAVFAASGSDAGAIAARVGIEHVDVVPNAVRVPASVNPRPGADGILFVGNLTYEPNRVAARLLAAEILPAVRSRRPNATLELVGRHDGSLDDLGRVAGVRVTGEVPDVTPHYSAADVVVVPLRQGSGTRIKVLEAFAHQRPVVATATAVAGLAVEPGRHVVVADPTGDIVRAVAELLADPARASNMIERAAHLVRDRYAPDAVAPLVRAVVLGPAEERGGPI